MDIEQIFELIKVSLIDGKLSCATAYQIAERHHINLSQIGQICEDKSIKIIGCQLGCF